MKRLALIGTLAASMLLASACTPPSGGGGGGSGGGGGTKIAIVNLDKVVQAHQWDQEVKSKLTTLNDTYESQLKMIAKALQDIVDAKQKEFGPLDRLTDAQKRDLGMIQMRAQQYYQAALNDRQNYINAAGRELLNQIRKALETPVRQIAQTNGYAIVLLEADNILFREDSVDLTNKVIDETTKNKPSIPLSYTTVVKDLPIPSAQTVTNPTTMPSSTTMPSR